VTPARPIVRKLIDRGHEVIWITGRAYRADVEATGARFHALPEEIDPGEKGFYELYPKLRELKGLAQIKWWTKHVFLDASVHEIEAIDTVLKGFSADVLVGDSITTGPYFRSEMGGPPCACLSVLPMCSVSRDTAPFGLGLLPGTTFVKRIRNQLLNFFVHHVLLRDVTVYANKIRRGLGLNPLEGPLLVAMPKKISLIMHVSTLAFEYARSDLLEHTHFIGPVLPEPDDEFQPPHWWSDLDRPEPVILVNQGTVAKDLHDLVVPTMEALRDQGMLLVAVPVEAAQLGTLPDNVRAEPFIPFSFLLPHVDVMVTNGGYGGTQRALAEGIPLVVAGETDDKMEVAARVEWAGAGINLRKKRPSPGEVRDAIKDVLVNPKYRENARRIQADFAKYDAPTRAAELLESLAAR
jgi:MGT family glycosyltransferase